MPPPRLTARCDPSGLDALRRAVMVALAAPAGHHQAVEIVWMANASGPGPTTRSQGTRPPADDPDHERLTALVDLARAGDADAFGALYDHYATRVYRFVYYRVGSTALAEDLTSETFFRALRSIRSFTWQGRDFGAWLTTIARNLITDHYKSSRSRLEIVADEVPENGPVQPSTEDDVVALLTNRLLMECLRQLASEQQDCLVMRFLQGLSIAETAASMGRSEGAVKQLQLRAVRNLAKLLPEDLR